jgi:hypothetical protein
MGKIIAGRFVAQAEVDTAVEKLVEAGFGRQAVAAFFVNSPGKHDLYPIGGDRDESPGTKSADVGAAAGAAGGGAIGAAAGSLAGPAGTLMGAAVGAYVGSLSGALDNMNKNDAARGTAANAATVSKTREAGMMLGVATPDAASESKAIQVLRAVGASDIERSHGQITDGDWVDFDPLAPPADLVR